MTNGCPARRFAVKPFVPATTALLLIDVINDFDFAGSEKLLCFALPAAKELAALKKRLKDSGVAVIYVNDNFGRWKSDFADLIERCKQDDCQGREIAVLLEPGDDDYFVLKPKHSGFYATSLPVFLASLGPTTLILSGFAGDICVLYTANDAYMRDFELIVATDCIASETEAEKLSALQQMEKRLKATLATAKEIRGGDADDKP